MHNRIRHVLLDHLHWLPVAQRVQFKLCLLTFKALYGLAPSYLANPCRPVLSVGSRRWLQSATRGDLVVISSTVTNFGVHSFAVAGSKAWNQLPSHTCNPVGQLRQNCSNIKTFLFLSTNSYFTMLWHVRNCRYHCYCYALLCWVLYLSLKCKFGLVFNRSDSRLHPFRLVRNQIRYHHFQKQYGMLHNKKPYNICNILYTYIKVLRLTASGNFIQLKVVLLTQYQTDEFAVANTTL